MSKLRGREKFNKFKPLIIMISNFFLVFPKRIRVKIFEHYRMTKGYKGLVLRYALLKSIAIECGENIAVHSGVYLLSPENIKIGNNVSIHPMCYIDATGFIEIGSDVSIAHGTTIMSTTHNYLDINIPIKDQGVQKNSTLISNNVWIGTKATILAGVSIAEGCIIAAGSVVTRSIDVNHVVAGVPAKTIKVR